MIFVEFRIVLDAEFEVETSEFQWNPLPSHKTQINQTKGLLQEILFIFTITETKNPFKPNFHSEVSSGFDFSTWSHMWPLWYIALLTRVSRAAGGLILLCAFLHTIQVQLLHYSEYDRRTRVHVNILLRIWLELENCHWATQINTIKGAGRIVSIPLMKLHTPQ